MGKLRVLKEFSHTYYNILKEFISHECSSKTQILHLERRLKKDEWEIIKKDSSYYFAVKNVKVYLSKYKNYITVKITRNEVTLFEIRKDDIAIKITCRARILIASIYYAIDRFLNKDYYVYE